MQLEALIDDVYESLEPLVKDSSIRISKKQLQRPPFTFLHKLILKLVKGYDLYDQMFNKLNSRDLKARFLTRGLAWVTFSLQNDDIKKVSALLLVSPVKVIAGLEVDRTLTYLSQLAEVYSDVSHESKIQATEKVKAIGDPQLYTISVKFRDGISKAQAHIRGRQTRNRIKKNTAAQDPKLSVRTQKNESCMEEAKIEIGTKFYKIFEGYGRFEGEVISFERGRYLVRYPEDEDEEEMDELELRRLIAELSTSPSKNASLKAAEEDKLSSLDCIEASSRPKKDELGLPPVSCSIDGDKLSSRADPSSNQKNSEEGKGGRFCPAVGSSWQLSLKKSLLIDQPEVHPLPSPSPNLDVISFVQKSEKALKAHKPTLPALLVPGGEENWKKRNKKQDTAQTFTLNPLIHRGETLNNSECKSLRSDNLNSTLEHVSSSTRKSTSKGKRKKSSGEGIKSTFKNNTLDSNSETRRIGSLARKPSAMTRYLVQTNKEDLFPTNLQALGVKTIPSNNSKLILNTVSQLQTHLKRRRMRVVDLFNHTDTDGNGYITSKELSEALGQLDIQLTAKEAKIFVAHIDKDNNGVVDIEELEKFVRMNRRHEARKEQVRKELNGESKESEAVEDSLRKLRRYRQRICDAFRTLDTDEEGLISSMNFRAAINRLDLTGVTADDVESLVKNCSSGADVVYDQMVKLLKNESIPKNEYLDNTWLSQFDSRLERVLKSHDYT